jgi:hypothetical protein
MINDWAFGTAHCAWSRGKAKEEVAKEEAREMS